VFCLDDGLQPLEYVSRNPLPIKLEVVQAAVIEL